MFTKSNIYKCPNSRARYDSMANIDDIVYIFARFPKNCFSSFINITYKLYAIVYINNERKICV